MTINKIFIIEQILRGNGCLNSRWFYDLFKYPIEKATGFPIFALTEKEDMEISSKKNIEIDINKFYSFYGIDNFNSLSVKEKNAIWVKLYYNTEYNKEAYEYIYSIFKDSLVIVHEMEQILVKILEYYNIPFIDINTDPVRFLDDQLFAFLSNKEEIYNELLKYKINEDVFYMYANYIKTANHYLEIITPNGNAVLFLGQTECDKTLIDPKTKEIYSILNHKDEFKNALKGFDKIYYKRHPLVDDDKDILDYIKTLSEVEIIDENFYQLLCRKNIKKVVSISSGGCIEAKYFGKETQSLLRESIKIQYGNDFDKEKYISIYNSYLNPSFWAKVLKPIMPTKEVAADLHFDVFKNKVRNSRGVKCYWSFEDLDQKITIFDMMPYINALSERISANEARIYDLEGRNCSLEGRINILEKNSFIGILKRVIQSVQVNRYR